MKGANQFGILAVALYYLLAVVFVLYALSCSTIYCGFAIVVPVIPWPFLFPFLFEGMIASFFAATILNAILVFFLGRYLGRLFISRHHRLELKEIQYRDENML